MSANRTIITILVVLSASVWLLAGVVLYGVDTKLAFFKPISVVVGFLSVLLAMYEKRLWRLPVFSWLHDVPDLEGTWIGERISEWRDAPEGKNPPPAVAVLVVKQTLSTIAVRGLSEESTSISLSASVVREVDDMPLLMYVFRNDPDALLQDHSRINHGGARLALGDDTLRGSYWTDRYTKGELTLRRVSRVRARDLSSAMKLDAQNAASQKVSTATSEPQVNAKMPSGSE